MTRKLLNPKLLFLAFVIPSLLLYSCNTNPNEDTVENQIDDTFDLIKENRDNKEKYQNKIDSLKNIEQSGEYSFNKEYSPLADNNNNNNNRDFGDAEVVVMDVNQGK